MNIRCTEYKLLAAQKQLKEAEKEAAKRELDTYTDRVFTQYQTAINGYLEMFGAGFRIDNVARRYAGGTPSSTYKIKINDTLVDVGDEKTPSGEPRFGTTLSGGDRSTLAFAFFLARLDEDDDLNSRTVIFDDPICSFDGHRQTCTQQQIARVCEEAGQVLVMSHDPYFLRKIWEHSDSATTKTLKIERAGQNSTIAEWNIERETRGEYFQNYFALGEYLENGSSCDLRAVARCIRPLLEGNLRMRFPGTFGRTEWLGDFIGKIRNAGSSDQLASMQPHLPELDAVNDFSKQYHHSNGSPAPDTASINDAELQAFVKRTLGLIGGIFVTNAGT